MATATVSGDARRHASFERRRQQVLGQSPSRLPRWLSPSSAASSRLDCWPRTRVRDASPRGSVLSARCLPDARTRRALAARCRGCRMLLARPTLPAGVRPKSFCATATLYSSERAWIHEKRGPPGGGPVPAAGGVLHVSWTPEFFFFALFKYVVVACRTIL